MSGSPKAKLFLIDDETGDRYEIGYGSFEQYADGSLDCKVTVIGDVTMKSNNLPGMTRLRVDIPASLRKD